MPQPSLVSAGDEEQVECTYLLENMDGQTDRQVRTWNALLLLLPLHHCCHCCCIIAVIIITLLQLLSCHVVAVSCHVIVMSSPHHIVVVVALLQSLHGEHGGAGPRAGTGRSYSV